MRWYRIIFYDGNAVLASRVWQFESAHDVRRHARSHLNNYNGTSVQIFDNRSGEFVDECHRFKPTVALASE